VGESSHGSASWASLQQPGALSVRADSYTNDQAMDFLKAGIARLLADPPPYEDSSLARKVRERPEAKALIDQSHRRDHRQN
jgi:hypothetical protein